MKSRLASNAIPSPRAQQGLVLLIALIVLVAMTLAGIALVRSVDTANIVAGNLAFKQGTIQEAESAVEAAGKALATVITDNTVNNLGQNYFATLQPTNSNSSGIPNQLTDTVAYDAAGFIRLPVDAQTKNTLRYIIDRMCAPGTVVADEINCSVSGVISEEGGSQPSGKTGADPTPIFRVTVRVDGPRNTVTYAQVMLRLS